MDGNRSQTAGFCRIKIILIEGHILSKFKLSSFLAAQRSSKCIVVGWSVLGMPTIKNPNSFLLLRPRGGGLAITNY